MRLVVDPVACDGHGLCAELLPEAVDLDEWGYPVLPRGPLPPGLLGRAGRAVAACPALALRLVDVEPVARGWGPSAGVTLPGEPVG
ncbi:ferredoxin [Actinosynnema pretiosum]|uniref:Ferredoxin n=1 Tax=Actinosynnema pretiosum TaxID=42197 RepID=A0A290ZG47_9PSEU|nr:ferredoxin [Actinosynnema pretiosum]